MHTTTFQGEFVAFRELEETLVTRLENVIKELKTTPNDIDPATNFWTVYNQVADEHDGDMLGKYSGDLDTSLLFAGLFSAISTAFIVQIIPSLQPNPSDLTNALLLRILQQNKSFGGSDPLAPVMNVSPTVLRAQSILFASLSVNLFAAFIAVLGKQWILYYKRASTWGSVVDRGKERQVKFTGLQKWGLHFIMELLPVLLQLALLLFGIGIIAYLWDIDRSAAEVIMVSVYTGFAFYAGIAVAATIWNDCPFQTPLSVFLLKAFPWAKKTTGCLFVGLSTMTWGNRSDVYPLMIDNLEPLCHLPCNRCMLML
ncbi:hypothetical protein BJ322DRAFT_177731 [Thelephora terrestris]|uniref:DUF6535 domain-containing protein n=1 Tax=Thelephora terrestris TaxID=56493 RepID=A0A9P6HB00_9AGAM|nr:hypothetical protein BJ322DRAFT_177731 [Thelephora terrestris]